MRTEKNYDFRKEMLQKHKANLLDPKYIPEESMVEITGEYFIVIPEDSNEVLLTGAQDLQEYLFTSMKRSLSLLRSRDLTELPGKSILVGTYEQLGMKWEH